MALHDFQDASKVLENAKTVVKPAGILVNLDWKKEPMEVGPPVRIRFSAETALSLIEGAGSTVGTVKDSGPYHYVVIAKP